MDRKFPTQYDKQKVETIPGSPIESVYSASYDEKGVIQLEVVGKRDVYADIQSHKDSVDINKILDRFSRGEIDVLSKVQGFYDDVTVMPKTYQEVLNSVIKSEQFFDSLPVDVKQKFNNSFSEFMVSTEKSDFLSAFSESASESVSDSPIEPVSDSVKDGE